MRAMFAHTTHIVPIQHYTRSKIITLSLLQGKKTSLHPGNMYEYVDA